MLWPKINSYKEFDNEKKFLRLENCPRPSDNQATSTAACIPNFLRNPGYEDFSCHAFSFSL